MLRVNHHAERMIINLLGSVKFDARGFNSRWLFFDFWFLLFFNLTFLGVLNGTSQHSINGGLV